MFSAVAITNFIPEIFGLQVFKVSKEEKTAFPGGEAELWINTPASLHSVIFPYIIFSFRIVCTV